MTFYNQITVAISVLSAIVVAVISVKIASRRLAKDIDERFKQLSSDLDREGRWSMPWYGGRGRRSNADEED